MENRPPQYCEDCIVPLTVKHLLAECPSHSDIRMRLYPQAEDEDGDGIMKIMLAEKPDGDFDCGPLLTYLQQTQLMNKIV